MGTPSKIILGNAEVYIGSAGDAPTTLCGFTRDGAEITWNLSPEEVTVSEEIMGFSAIVKAAEVTVKCELAESVTLHIQRAIGESSGTFTKDLAKFSLKVLGVSSGTKITLTCLNGYSESTDLVIKRGDAFYIPLSFKALANVDGSTGAVTYPTIAFA